MEVNRGRRPDRQSGAVDSLQPVAASIDLARYHNNLPAYGLRGGSYLAFVSLCPIAAGPAGPDLSVDTASAKGLNQWS